MTKQRILAYVFSIVACLTSFFVYMNYFWMAGFPDGFMTELQHGQQTLYGTFLTETVLLTVVFFVLGARKSSHKTVNCTIGVFFLSTILVLAIDAYLKTILMGSGGG